MIYKNIFAALLSVTGLLFGCGGGGGNSSTDNNSGNISSTISASTSQINISTDISKNIYPISYNATGQLSVIDDTCLLTATSIRYPESYKGAFILPKVNGSFANKNIALSISPKDDWVNSGGPANPNLNRGCTTNHKEAFISSLRRLKSLGATYLTIYSSTRLDDAYNPSVLSDYFISDSDIIWMGQQAAEYGIKIRFAMQIDIWDQKGNSIYVALNGLNVDQQKIWINKFLELYKIMMLHEASVMASSPNNFDAIKIDWGYFDPLFFNNNKIIKINALIDLSQAIRRIYNWRQWINHFSATDFLVLTLTLFRERKC